MKDSLLQHLICPSCKGLLDLEVEVRNGSEIERGGLTCRACAARYPITKGVPRFVPTDSYVKSFSFEWRIHWNTQVDSLAGHSESKKTFDMKTGLTESELQGKLTLDVGCGTGRFMEIAAERGAEVIGLDLSYAVDVAYENMGSRPGIHVVQADLFKLPFRPATFDVIYSIGVLHHTPNTRSAFVGLPPLLKPAGVIAIWVYEWGGDYSILLDRVRAVAVHLPKPLLYGLCWVGVPLLNWMADKPLLGRVARRIPTSNQHLGRAWDVLDTFDNYAPRYQWKHTDAEVREWFEKEGLEDLRFLGKPVSVRGRLPRSR